MSNQFDTFDIQLAKDGPHLSGDALKGDLLLKTKKDLSFARIVVHLYGGGRVEIDASGTATQAAQAKSAASSTIYRDSQTYLSHSQVLLDRGSLTKGRLYKLPFELHLPDRLPSSHGSIINYSLTALADRGNPGKASCLSLPVTVIGRVDLNLQPGGGDGGQLWQPIEVWGHWQQSTSRGAASVPEQRQRLDGLGLATVRLLAHKRGFAIGESMSLEVEVRNNTKLRLDSVRISLTQKAVMRAAAAEGGGPAARKEHRTAVQICRLQERLKPGASLLEDAVQLTVPWVATAPVPGSCRLLRISYWIQVICSVTPDLHPVASLEPVVQTLLTGQKLDKPEQSMVLLEEPIVIGTNQLVSPAGTAASAETNRREPPPRPSAPPPAMIRSERRQSAGAAASSAAEPSAPPSYEESLLQRLREEDATGVFA
ncbi:hypothetical protein BOX15_Mlig022846g2 [Macrostomum lignano]|uniref:Arrestin C-terminal-like domain-containing protein n=1 Tax=Macrostomum lignano TaxID=282301 RepID=A0A267E1M4_9PLAT|nr:hypothetical protein BOX15_Mlig022846g2 [Macrostomum lignano]